jgi:hypothetical protein
MHCTASQEKVAGLLAGIDIRCANPHAVDEVGQLDGLDRAHLDALAALDATRQEVLFVESTRRAQAVLE